MSASSNSRFIFVKRFVKTTLFLALLLLLFLLLFWLIIRKDNPYVLNKIKSHAAEQWSADLKLKGYELKLRSPFPKLELQLNELQFGVADSTSRPLFKTNTAFVKFDPWDLYKDRQLENYVELDSTWVLIHHDSLDNSNLHFSDRQNSEQKQPVDFKMANLINIKANYIDFRNQNDFRSVWQAFQLSQANILPGFNSREELTFELKSDVHFDGLLFKPNDGAFLKNTTGRLQANLGWNKKEGLIRLDDSHLKTTQDSFQISGLISQGTIDTIRLDIIDDDILLAELLPKLSDKARKALGKIKVDQPIKGHFALDNLIVPNRNGAVNIDFETAGANIEYDEASISRATLKGSYSNDCDGNGLGDPVTSCIILDQLDGDIFGRLPTELRGSISNLRNPAVDMVGKMDVDLPRLNPLLTTKEKMNFNDGKALINFNYTGALRKIITDPFNEEFTKMDGSVAFQDIIIKTGENGLTLPALTGHMSFSESQSRLQDLSLNWMGSNILIKGQIGNLPEFLFYRKAALQSNLDLYFDELDINQFKKKDQPKVKLSEELINQYIKSLAYNINGNIDLKIDKLIVDTFFVTDLKTNFKLFTPQENTLLDSTLIQINKLTGNLFDESPFELDLNILNQPTTTIAIDLRAPMVAKTANRLLENKTAITHGDAGVSLTAKAPLSSLFNKKELLNNLNYKGEIDLVNISLFVKDMPVPVKEISGSLAFDSNRLLVDTISFLYKGSPFYMRGTIDNYAFFQSSTFEKGLADLTIQGNYFDARYEQPQNAEDRIKYSFSPPELFRSLDTVFQYTSGSLNLSLDSILTNDHIIEPFFMSAQLLPNQHKPDEHQLHVDSVRMGFGADNYVQGHLKILDLTNPFVTAKFDANMNLNRLGDLLRSEYINLRRGHFDLTLDYASALHDTLDSKHYILDADIDGTANISEGSIYYNYRDFTFNNVLGQFAFDENTLQIPSLSMTVNENDLSASGESVDFFPFFILPDKKASIDLSVASNNFDFGNFSTPQKIKTHATGARNLIVKTKRDPTSRAIEQTLGYIDQLLAQGTIKMDTDIKSVNYRKFDATDFEGLVVVKPDTVLISDVNMKVAKGTFGIDGSISGIVNHQPTVSVALKMEDNDLQELLTQLENFDQDAFTDENIQGNISAEVNFSSDITEDYAFKSESMDGDMFLKIEGGNVKDIEALSTKKGFLAKGRKLDDIQLDTLVFETKLRGNELWVNRTRVNSSPGDFHIEGVYDLETRQNSRMLLTVPLRNLFKRYNSLEEMEKNRYKGKGIPILIESRYKKGKLKFKWKLFVNKKKKGFSVPSPSKSNIHK